MRAQRRFLRQPESSTTIWPGPAYIAVAVEEGDVSAGEEAELALLSGSFGGGREKRQAASRAMGEVCPDVQLAPIPDELDNLFRCEDPHPRRSPCLARTEPQVPAWALALPVPSPRNPFYVPSTTAS